MRLSAGSGSWIGHSAGRMIHREMSDEYVTNMVAYFVPKPFP